MPWVLAKEETQKERLMTVLYNLLESIRVSACFLYPYLPTTSEEILRQLNIDDDTILFNKENVYNTITPEPLFKRIDVKNV